MSILVRLNIHLSVTIPLSESCLHLHPHLSDNIHLRTQQVIAQVATCLSSMWETQLALSS